MLDSNGGNVEVPQAAAEESDSGHSTSSGWKKVIKARSSKGGSLLFVRRLLHCYARADLQILISVGVIYYLTERHRLPLSTPSLYGYTPTTPAHPSVPTPFATLVSDFPLLSVAERFWRSLNPLGLSHVRALVPPASILVLPRLGHAMRPADLRKLSLPTSRIVLPRLKPLFYLFKVVVLPEAVTAGTLYIILLYLLKDSELLDAQRNRLGRNEEHRDSDDEVSPAGRGLKGVQIHLLPCSHRTDIDVIASSNDGKVLVSAGIDGTLYLWRFGASPGSGTREPLSSESLSQDDEISCVAVSPDGKIVLVLTGEGVLHRWEVINDESPVSRGSHDINIPDAVEIKLVEVRNGSEDPFLARPSSPIAAETAYTVLVSSSRASMVSISPAMEITTVVPPNSSAVRALFLDCDDAASLAFLVLGPDEAVLYRCIGSEWFDIVIPAMSDTTVSTASLTTTGLVLGYRSGLIEVYDINGTPVIAVGGGSTSGPVHPPSLEGVVRVAMATPAASSCTTCGLVSTDSTFIISSTSERVFVDRLNSRGNIPCRCRRGSLVDDSKYPAATGTGSPARLAIPPAANRGGFSPGCSPKKSPTLLPPVSNGEFPLSSHGTRRLSALHRDETISPYLGLGNVSTATNSPDSDLEILPLGAILAPGGGSTWCVTGDLLLGLRRVRGGIDDGQWEIWTVDLRAPWNGSSLVVEAAPLTSLLQRGATVPFASVRAQRTERLLSLSGRAAFPSVGASVSVETFPPLAYTEVRPFYPVSTSVGSAATSKVVGEAKSRIVIGLGNRMGVISVPESKEPRHQSSSTQSSNKGMGIGLSGIGLGVTPPPPSMRREVGYEKKVL